MQTIFPTNTTRTKDGLLIYKDPVFWAQLKRFPFYGLGCRTTIPDPNGICEGIDVTMADLVESHLDKAKFFVIFCSEHHDAYSSEVLIDRLPVEAPSLFPQKFYASIKKDLMDSLWSESETRTVPVAFIRYSTAEVFFVKTSA